MALWGKDPELNLRLAIESFKASSTQFRKEENWKEYVWYSKRLGNAYRKMAHIGINSPTNTDFAVQAYEATARVSKMEGMWDHYAEALALMGLCYFDLASLEVKREQNLLRCESILQMVLTNYNEHLSSSLSKESAETLHKVRAELHR